MVSLQAALTRASRYRCRYRGVRRRSRPRRRGPGATAEYVRGVATAADVDDVLLTTCRKLLGQVDQHNSKEEPIIYPHAATGLTEEAGAELAGFLQNGSTPDG